MNYTPPGQLPVCPFLNVQEFELRPPDSDDWDNEPPTFPNAMPICTCPKPCRYETQMYPQPWHDWYPQTVCCGYSVAYADAAGAELHLTVEAETATWWPRAAPFQPQPEATRDEQVELIANYLITPALRDEFRTWERKWGYDGAVAYMGRMLQQKQTPAHVWHWPEARVRKGSVDIWHCGYTYPAKPSETISLAEFIRNALPPAPPAGEQLSLF